MKSESLLQNAESTPPVMTVSALNQAVARLLERSFPLAWVSGEISNFTRASSGHWYFTLKDDTAQVKAVMFRGRAQYADFMPREGDMVEVRALVTLYAARGDYQLNVEAIRRAGIGNLYEAFLQLKNKLTAEGLFDTERKRPLPYFCKTIGVVTSPQAAALRDILTTLRRRAPHLNVILYPAPVQGEGAAEKIARAIAAASERAECDVLLVCRGGGSIEDLWSFNHESVARAIACCSMPVISGVGHETDFTIADFAADLRAPTPTAAAEMAAVPRADWMATLEMHADDLTRALRRTLSNAAQTLDWLSRRVISPSMLLAHDRLKLRSLNIRLVHSSRKPMEKAKFDLMQLKGRWSAQLPKTEAHHMRISALSCRLSNVISSRTTEQRQALATLSSQLELLNPQRTLERGYAIVTDAKGKVIRSPKQLRPNNTLTMRLAEGSAEVGISGVQPSLE